MQQSLSLIAGAVLSALLCSAAFADETPVNTAGLYERAARGNIVEPGGARRLSGDQTAALKASLSDKTVKNVILLIGDGMGDSEITSARNYAEGAGGYFKGIDALPLTGQYTITRWIRKPTNRIT